MKCLSSVLILSLFNLLCFVKYGSTIFCYDCNSAFDPRCGEDFNFFSIGVVNCSLQDPPEHMPDVEPTLCRTIKMEIYGKTRVVRQCGYLADESPEKSCRRSTHSGDVFVTYCNCDTDLCNSAPAHQGAAVLVAASLCVLFVSRF